MAAQVVASRVVLSSTELVLARISCSDSGSDECCLLLVIAPCNVVRVWTDVSTFLRDHLLLAGFLFG
jgi:hypothetical protein